MTRTDDNGLNIQAHVPALIAALAAAEAVMDKNSGASMKNQSKHRPRPFTSSTIVKLHATVARRDYAARACFKTHCSAP
jgi:hypothetical protein